MDTAIRQTTRSDVVLILVDREDGQGNRREGRDSPGRGREGGPGQGLGATCGRQQEDSGEWGDDVYRLNTILSQDLQVEIQL